MTFDELLEAFAGELYLHDTAPIEVMMATYVANLLPGDAVWTALIAPPSYGKTELLNTLAGPPRTHEASTMSVAGLLTASTSNTPGATGGLLAEISRDPERLGIILCKDFTTPLSLPSEQRLALFAALRDVYDGKLIRRTGGHGGRTIAWTGKAGMIVAVTESIDRYGDLMASMGQRFTFLRMMELTDQQRIAQGKASMRNAGRQAAMRRTLAKAVQEFVGGLTIPSRLQPLPADVAERLTLLADFATRCRSSVERSGQLVEVVPYAEALSRFQSQLAQLWWAFGVTGVDVDRADALIARLARDALAKDRLAVVEALVHRGEGVTASSGWLADRIGLPAPSAVRALEGLHAHDVVDRWSDPDETRWAASDWLIKRWPEVRPSPADRVPRCVGNEEF
jgi:hypothetical protein